MNPMLFGSMKFAALIAVLAFSAAGPQVSTCRCDHCPSNLNPSAGDSSTAPDSVSDCCCSTESPTGGEPCPCGCQQIKTDPGLKPQSEVLSLDFSSDSSRMSWGVGPTRSSVSALASPAAVSGVAVCIALCRFRL